MKYLITENRVKEVAKKYIHDEIGEYTPMNDKYKDGKFQKNGVTIGFVSRHDCYISHRIFYNVIGIFNMDDDDAYNLIKQVFSEKLGIKIYNIFFSDENGY